MGQAFGASSTTVQNWVNDPGFPGGRRGPWVESSVDLYLRRKGSPKVEGDDHGGRSSTAAQATEIMLVAKARKTVAEAEYIELKNKKAKGELVARDEVKAELEDVFAFLRDGILRFPDDGATEVPAEFKPVVIAVLRRKAEQLLQAFADKAARVGD